MKADRWDSVKELLHVALQLPLERRPAFLDEVCSSDLSLRAELESLLSADADVRSGFLESPPANNMLGTDVNQVAGSYELKAGQVFAQRFRLIRKLGEGGMGQVWLAEQTAPICRPVALKLIKAGMYDESVVQRFQTERQSLAIMDHPAIAKVFDAGTTSVGQPYFVMEYVPGLPITEYCDQKKLKITERLELFIQACEGVQHAHQKAIIHRDLKPANMLVVEVDGKPVPRIIDFGLAKATTPQADGQSIFTQLGHFVGTPGYMSPEQADPQVKDIDTRTDVYSLGAILYVLLSGGHPLDKANGTVPLDELLRRLREEEPPTPSAKVSRDRKVSSATAEARGTEPRHLVSLLRGDLDWITMRALEKDRGRRYGTPSELAADIRRYLRHEPVMARSASTAYRLSKYVRRHRIALATASAVALTLIVAAVVSIREGIRANREAAVAEAVDKFLQNDLLAQAGASAQSGPSTKPDPDLKVRTALDRAAERIEGKFAKQPDVEAAVRETMGLTYVDLGLYPEARKQLERVLKLRQRALGAEDAKTLRSMTNLGRVAYLQGMYAEAEELESQALETQRRILGPEHPDTLASINNLANVYDDEDKYAQAEALDLQTLEIRKRVLGPEHPDTLKSTGNLGVDYVRDGKYSEAEGLLTQALEIQKRVLGPEHPDTLASHTNLAGLYFQERKYAQAEALFTEELEIRKRVLGLEHPDTAQNLYNLACTAAQQGNKDRAIALLRQSVDHIPRNNALLIEKDTDLASLHDDPRFAALVAHARQGVEGKQKAAPTQALQ
jgi:serine/threonine protein kinase/tetratricopeptide (TPR) repeat protein